MKVATDQLIAALINPRLYLMGNEDGGVELHCRDHFDGGRPLAYYGDAHPDSEMTTVQTVSSLWAEAVKHLDKHHTVPLPPTQAMESDQKDAGHGE